jgi:homoserine kinase
MDDLHAAIMNIPYPDQTGMEAREILAYKAGHRDARHAAAELAAALSQPAAAQGDSSYSAGGECDSVPAPTRQKLTPAQVDLFQAMERGVVVHFISGIDARYFRTDRKRVSSVTINALIDKGWAERTKVDWRGCIVKLKATP